MKDWMKNIRQVVPYVPGEQPKIDNIIKLNTNENPYGPSPKAAEVLRNLDGLRLYPDPSSTLLINALADYHNVGNEQVFVGVGSDDVLAIAFMTFFNSSKPIFFPDITYSFYDVWADLFRIPYETKPLNQNFEINKEDYYAANGGVIFANPNAPTGLDVDLQFIEDVLNHNQDAIVIIDEAYVDFGAVSAIELVNKYENLLVVQTFSKSRSMAGMRIGYAIGSSQLIQAMNAVKNSYNSYTMNKAAICTGAAVLEDEEYFKEKAAAIIRTREWFKEELKRLGFVFPDSKANFVFACHKIHKAADIAAAARKKGIIVRHFNKPKIDNYLRITIGTDDEMVKFVSFLKEYLK